MNLAGDAITRGPLYQLLYHMWYNKRLIFIRSFIVHPSGSQWLDLNKSWHFRQDLIAYFWNNFFTYRFYHCFRPSHPCAETKPKLQLTSAPTESWERQRLWLQQRQKTIKISRFYTQSIPRKYCTMCYPPFLDNVLANNPLIPLIVSYL